MRRNSTNNDGEKACAEDEGKEEESPNLSSFNDFPQLEAKNRRNYVNEDGDKISASSSGVIILHKAAHENKLPPVDAPVQQIAEEASLAEEISLAEDSIANNLSNNKPSTSNESRRSLHIPKDASLMSTQPSEPETAEAVKVVDEDDLDDDAAADNPNLGQSETDNNDNNGATSDNPSLDQREEYINIAMITAVDTGVSTETLTDDVECKTDGNTAVDTAGDTEVFTDDSESSQCENNSRHSLSSYSQLLICTNCEQYEAIIQKAAEKCEANENERKNLIDEVEG